MRHPINDALEVFKVCMDETSSDSDHDLLQELINALEEIKVSLNEYGTMKYKISHFDEILSANRIEDEKVFEAIYSVWNNFKDSYVREIGGMTVIERLSHLGLIDDFDASIDDPSMMKDVLQAAFLSSTNIEAIVSSQCKQAKRDKSKRSR